jgi:peptidoglycan/LPS O-acetylase OafA/YrhL
VAIAATVAAAGTLAYLLWLIFEERTIKRYRREQSEVARLILAKRPADERPVDEERPAEKSAPARYVRNPRLAHSYRH